MGWIKCPTADGNEPDHVVQGPNLLLVPKDKKGPKADFTEERFYDGSVFKHYPNGFLKRPVMWVVESQLMLLTNVYHWRFVQINEAYARFHVMTQPPVIECPLYMYVNLIEIQCVEETYDELSRTVPYQNEWMLWEPRHIEYHPPRLQV